MTNTAQLLQNLALSGPQAARLSERYVPVLAGKNIWKLSGPGSAPTVPNDGPGIYFWVLTHQEQQHRIYVGKTRSLRSRINNYTSVFQPHSPNDFKLQVFYAFVKELLPNSDLSLYFSPCNINLLTQREKEEIKCFAPLLNRRMKSNDDLRHKLQTAFTVYYQSCFLEAMDTT